MASSASLPSRTWQFLTLRRGGKRWHWTDLFTYGYLGLGIFLMFGPVVWLVLSSFKTPAGLLEFPPTWAPLGQVVVEVEGIEDAFGHRVVEPHGHLEVPQQFFAVDVPVAVPIPHVARRHAEHAQRERRRLETMARPRKAPSS